MGAADPHGRAAMESMSTLLDALARLLGKTTARKSPLADPDEAVREFSRHIGIPFRDAMLLRRALTHRSFLGGESALGPDSNERLEFLGDAVLELIVIEHLYQHFPKDREGELTQKKSLLVSRSVLADRAEAMNLGRYVLLSNSERDSGGGERRSILADTFEATLGAIYIDQGLRTARGFVERWLLRGADHILHDADKRNFKSILQEQIQAEFRVHPRYRVVSEQGPDHNKRFTVEVVVAGRVLGSGTGTNKKEAEQQAARSALSSPNLAECLHELSTAGN